MRRNRTTSFDKRAVASDDTMGPGDSPRSANPRDAVSNDLRTLSRRMISWSGNLLATAAIVIVGLTFGKQVLHWWHGDPPSIVAVEDDMNGSLNGLSAPRLPHLIAFGNLPMTFDRALFEGSEKAALGQLRASCRALASDFDARKHLRIPVSENLLRYLERCESVEEGTGWRIVQNVGPVITVVALHVATGTPADRGEDASQNPASVVSWGLGLRSVETGVDESPGHWMLYTCSSSSQRVDSDSMLALPIPAKSRRTFTARVKEGGALVGFTGFDKSSSVMRFFDTSLGERGWTRAAEWNQIGNAWHGRFRKLDVAACDIQVLSGSDGTTSGILTIAKTAKRPEK